MQTRARAQMKRSRVNFPAVAIAPGLLIILSGALLLMICLRCQLFTTWVIIKLTATQQQQASKSPNRQATLWKSSTPSHQSASTAESPSLWHCQMLDLGLDAWPWGSKSNVAVNAWAVTKSQNAACENAFLLWNPTVHDRLQIEMQPCENDWLQNTGTSSIRATIHHPSQPGRKVDFWLNWNHSSFCKRICFGENQWSIRSNNDQLTTATHNSTCKVLHMRAWHNSDIPGQRVRTDVKAMR